MSALVEALDEIERASEVLYNLEGNGDIGEKIQALRARLVELEKPCVWSLKSDEFGWRKTSCGSLVDIFDRVRAVRAEFVFCYHCGQRIILESGPKEVAP